MPQQGTAVVTGGSSGIGRAIAERLAAEGHDVATLDLNPAGPNGYKADVTDRAQVEEAFAAVRERQGPVTTLVNAAGIDGFHRFRDLPFETWSRVIDVNLNGTFHCIQTALPDMLAAKYGRIVNISSSSAEGGQPFMAHYVAAKAAVNGLTKSLALELGPKGITVNAVPPGFIDTPMLRAAADKGLLGGTIESHVERTPVRRIGRPEDIANMCAFLASPDAGYVTGQILVVSGGRNT
jgi:2-hydroxycyclohexanecarboxyl-CoA dehydrogenase